MYFLNESKRIWLLSYITVAIGAIILGWYKWENIICRTIVTMVLTMLGIMCIQLIVAVIFEWISKTRIISSLVYLSAIIFEVVNGYLKKWYIIIPVFILMLLYMLWNMGGVVNCIIINRYNLYLIQEVDKGKELYKEYSGEVSNYNEVNNLGFFRKVRKKKEPNWSSVTIYETGLDMFRIRVALYGVDENDLIKKVNKIDKINTGLVEKNNVIITNKKIINEKEQLEETISKEDMLELENSNLREGLGILEKQRLKSVKKGTKVLRKRI